MEDCTPDPLWFLPDNDKREPRDTSFDHECHLCCLTWQLHECEDEDFKKAGFKVLEKFEPHCFACGDLGELWVHYGDRPGQIDDEGDTVVLLCRTCHQQRHHDYGEFYRNASEIVELNSYRDYQANQD